EQGRAVQASPEALGRLARALALTRAERAYLFELAGRLDPEAPPPRAAEAPASLRALVEAVACPAYGLDQLWNACCWNAAAASLFQGWLDGPGQPNLLRFVFETRAARSLIPDWEHRARRLLAEFRADYGHSFRDAEVRTLVAALRRDSPFFAQAWDGQDVQHREGGLRAFTHPEQGALLFEQHSFVPSEAPAYKLVLLRPVR
ncbi:MAG: transcriptional regulator, partial [Geminicoccaceae bacterium]